MHSLPVHQNKSKPRPFKLEADAELTSRPKYVSIPEFGVVVLESRHAANWSGPACFNEDFNKFLFVVSGAVQLCTPEKTWNLRKDSLVHVTAHTKHTNKDISAEPVVVYVIHYRGEILPAALSTTLSRHAITQWNLIDSRSNVARSVSLIVWPVPSVMALLSNSQTTATGAGRVLAS